MKSALLFLVLLLDVTAFSQRFSIEIGGGYQRNMVASTLESSYNVTTQNSDIETEKAEKFGYSNGIIERIQLNYQLNPELFLFFGGRYVSGKQDIVYAYYLETSPNYSSEDTYSYNSTYKSLDVQVGLGIRKQLADRISLSSSVALSIAPFTRYEWTESHVQQQSSGSTTSTFTFEESVNYENYVNLGWYSDLGITYALNRHFDLCAAVAFRGISTSPSKSTQTSYILNGVDQIAAIPANELVNIYLKDPTPNTPNEYNRFWNSRTSAEMTVGIRYKIGGTPISEKTVTESPRFYAELASGYGIPLGVSYHSSGTNLETDKRTSLGQGVYGMAFIGIPLKQVVSLEAGVVYNTMTTEYYSPNSLTKYGNSANMLRVALGLKVSHQLGQFQVAIKTGALTGVYEKVLVRSEGWGYKREELFSGGFTLGAYSSIQLDWNFSKNFGVFCQTMAIIQGWSPKQSEYKHYSYNGEDQLANFTVAEAKTEYMSEYDENEYDPNKPSKQLKTIEPLGSLVFSIGIRYSLW